MKPMTSTEIGRLAEELQHWRGARLQEASVTGSRLALGLWRNGRLEWLVCDLHPQRPVLLPLADPPEKVRSAVKPVLLFLRAHVMGAQLRDVVWRPEEGRVLRLGFVGSEISELEFRLFPKGQNLIVRTGEKRVSWNPVQDLTAAPTDVKEPEPRTLEQLRAEWVGPKDRSDKAGAPALDSVEAARREWRRRREKIQTAIAKVEVDLGEKRQSPWRSVGDWIVAHQSLDVPLGWRSYIERDRGLSWNIDTCYRRAKDTERKLQGTEQRLAELMSQLRELDAVSDFLSWHRHQAARPGANSGGKKTAETRGRSLSLEEGLVAFAGKSARDNLAVLRQARPWDFWVHLKDFPSSHAILKRAKNQTVSDQILRRVGQWLAGLTFGAKAATRAGEKIDILVTECRYVRPIKGDRLGRVTYTETRVIALRFEPEWAHYAPQKKTRP